MEFLTTLVESSNETLAAAIVVTAVSLLLYNLTRNRHNRVSRTSAIVLACVTLAYIVDVFVALGPDGVTYEAALRLQWIGIAFMPAAMLHLSDALLATTGLASRGRRRRIIRILYLISSMFLIMAGLTNVLVQPIAYQGNISIQAGIVFPLYIVFFILVNSIAFVNVQRARRRCLTRRTRRRMAYLQIAILTPALGTFPYSVLLAPGEEYTLLGLSMVVVTNMVVILMLLFLSYPLSFFGSDRPDRVVKAELLDFLLHGPATGLLILAIITFTTQATRIMSLRGEDFMPFAVVTAVLLWQWTVSLGLPWLERRLIYYEEGYSEVNKLQNLNQYLATSSDYEQLIEATLEAACDYLRVKVAFVGTLNGTPNIVTKIGHVQMLQEQLHQESDFQNMLQEVISDDSDLSIIRWQSFWITPLFSRQTNGHDSEEMLVNGFLGLEASSDTFDLTSDDEEMFYTFIERIEQTLHDMQIQTDIQQVLDGIIPQIHLTDRRLSEVEYRPGRALTTDPLYQNNDMFEAVQAALRHYWGGSGITKSLLLELKIVQHQLAENDDTPVSVLRQILTGAIENLRPPGEQKFMSPEWTLYNILHFRFIKKRKVRVVAKQLSMSESDLYRKQRVAIEHVADILLQMEAAASSSS